MKFGKYIAIIAVVTFSLSLNAFAKDKDNQTHVTFYEKVQVGSTDLKPGDYKLQWDGNGPDVQVRFVQGRNVVVTAPAKLLQSESQQGNDFVTADIGGSNELKEVDFAGGRQSLVFEQVTPTQDAGGQQ